MIMTWFGFAFIKFDPLLNACPCCSFWRWIERFESSSILECIASPPLLTLCNKIRNCNCTQTSNQLLVQVHLGVSRNLKEANFEEQTWQLKGSVLVNGCQRWISLAKQESAH